MVCTSCKSSHNILRYFHVIIWGLGLFVVISLQGGGEGGLRSFDIWGGVIQQSKSSLEWVKK